MSFLTTKIKLVFTFAQHMLRKSLDLKDGAVITSGGKDIEYKYHYR